MAEGKVVKANRFLKKFPKQYAYVFDDPKDANEFYKYINAKYQIAYDDAMGNVPVTIGEDRYYLTFYEANKETQTINLVPMMVDAALEQEGYGKPLESAEFSRYGKWYLVLTVTDDNYKDALYPEYEEYKNVLKYVSELRSEYLSTTHYIEVYLKAK